MGYSWAAYRLHTWVLKSMDVSRNQSASGLRAQSEEADLSIGQCMGWIVLLVLYSVVVR